MSVLYRSRSICLSISLYVSICPSDSLSGSMNPCSSLYVRVYVCLGSGAESGSFFLSSLLFSSSLLSWSSSSFTLCVLADLFFPVYKGDRDFSVVFREPGVVQNLLLSERINLMKKVVNQEEEEERKKRRKSASQDGQCTRPPEPKKDRKERRVSSPPKLATPHTDQAAEHRDIQKRPIDASSRSVFQSYAASPWR